LFEDEWCVVENEYSLETEPNVAALLTTGNGYIGVRGSLEEFGSLRIQGCYIRGLIDKIYELPQPFADNMYMKKYYFDEDRLKHFEKQDCIINFIDILLVRVKVGGETFYPWEGDMLSWKRTLDMKSNCLFREVRWKNNKGDISIIKFERFSSFDDDHVYCIKLSVTPENHNEVIEIISGLDLRTKTNGQRVAKTVNSEVFENKMLHVNLSGDSYRFTFCTGVCNSFYPDGETVVLHANINDGDFLANTISFQAKTGKTYTLEKKMYVITSRDTDENLEGIVRKKLKELDEIVYDKLFESHVIKWRGFFKEMDVKIKGDESADVSLRFSTYHTAIAIARNDAVHSLAAKGLTGEAYNNFVWWDCEVYQAPIFFHTVPQAGRNILQYRYNKLDAARQIAKAEGRRGARFPFTSSVTGEETVWEFARHPFMQIHVVADVAWAVLNYHACTGDTKFMIEFGNELLWEIARYWASRVEYNEPLDRYEIKNVTGTDEHHPYVDNNAYTNYLVCFVLKNAVRMYKTLKEASKRTVEKINLQSQEINAWDEISKKLYLPMDEDTGMIPQFDGYFRLDKGLEVKGGSTAKAFQMKESGLYHESQVIKQPDVMLLFSYLNFTFNDEVYRRNWNYYEARCEASSSLSYPVHSICASDMGQPESAYRYFMKSARLDLDDGHDCAWQGMHSACAAGAWLAVVRGVAGIVFREDMIEVRPNMIPWWQEVSFYITWHGQKLEVSLNNRAICIKSNETNKSSVPLESKGKMFELAAGGIISLDIAVKGKVVFA